MLYELPTGKTIDIPSWMLTLDDDKFDEYIQCFYEKDTGFYTDDFFHQSEINQETFEEPEEIEEFPDDTLLLDRDDI